MEFLTNDRLAPTPKPVKLGLEAVCPKLAVDAIAVVKAIAVAAREIDFMKLLSLKMDWSTVTNNQNARFMLNPAVVSAVLKPDGW
jgi:hypothetical protein